MKKRTKRKLAKFSKKLSVGILKLTFVYPFKGLWFLTKQFYEGIQKLRQHAQQNKQTKTIEKQRPKIEAAYNALEEIKNKKGSVRAFEQKLLTNKSTIGIILGARGSGKSAIGMRLLENFKAKTSKKIYALGFKPESLPKWITVISDINSIANNSVVLIDEGGIEFGSRRAMSNANKILSELLLISRHRDLNVLFITQNSANLEINALRQADFLLLKPSSLLQKDFERKKVKNIYDMVEEDFAGLKETVGLTYVYSDSYQGFVANSLPGFWSEQVSKGYAKRK